MPNFEGSIIVRSSDGSTFDDYLFEAELDEILNVDYLGEPTTTITPGSVAYIAVNHSSNIVIDSVVPTDGSIQFYNVESREKIDPSVLFAGRTAEDADVHDLPVIPNSYSLEYLGRPGKVSAAASAFGQVSLTGDVTKTPFMAKITTTYQVKIYKLFVPDMVLAEDESYPIAIVFYISKVA
jgi:hypothetical protein